MEQLVLTTDIQVFVVTFSSILWEALPFIILGAIVAGILEELLPQELIGRILPGYALPAVMIGGLLGLVFPMCECGIVVVMRRLLRKGLPLSSCIAYMLAGPIVNVVVLLSTYVAFGGLGDTQDPARSTAMKQTAVEITLLRAGMGFCIAVITGSIVHVLQKRDGMPSLVRPLALPPVVKSNPVSLHVVNNRNHNHMEDDSSATRRSLMQRLGNISETALHDFMDITVFLIIGAVLAALVKLWIDADQIRMLSMEQPYFTIPAMMALAVVLCLCSEADAFVAASFTEMAPSAKLSFLVLGPMLDLKLLMMYTRVFRWKLIFAIVVSTVTFALIASLLVHQFYDPKQLIP